MNLQNSNPNSKLKLQRLQVASKRPESFECVHCHRTYVREGAYIAHKCPIRVRLEEMRSPLGQAAYMFYAKWMHANRRSIPEQATFMTSKYYEPFIRFAKFNKVLQLPSTDLYVQVMMLKNLTPELWTDDRAYSIYLEHMEFHIDPKVSVKITSDELEKLSKEYECEISDVFTQCNPNEIIQKIRERKLSPWILLKSQKFGQFIGTLSSEQLAIVETLIDSSFWKMKFKKDPITAKFMSLCASSLGI